MKFWKQLGSMHNGKFRNFGKQESPCYSSPWPNCDLHPVNPELGFSSLGLWPYIINCLAHQFWRRPLGCAAQSAGGGFCHTAIGQTNHGTRGHMRNWWRVGSSESCTFNPGREEVFWLTQQKLSHLGAFHQTARWPGKAVIKWPVCLAAFFRGSHTRCRF